MTNEFPKPECQRIPSAAITTGQPAFHQFAPITPDLADVRVVFINDRELKGG
jgi:hypothetical protein